MFASCLGGDDWKANAYLNEHRIRRESPLWMPSPSGKETPRMKTLGLLIGLSILALTAVGCGDDDESGTAAEQTTTVSEQEFQADASQICADANKELNQVQSFPKEGPPIIEQALSDLEDLTPPSAEQDTFDQFVKEGQDAVEELETGEAQGDPFDEFTRLGEQLGIEGGCTRAGQGSG
jgi:hypothetical protein